MSGKCLILYTWVHDFGIETNPFNPEDYTNCLYFIPASTIKFLLFVFIWVAWNCRATERLLSILHQPQMD